MTKREECESLIRERFKVRNSLKWIKHLILALTVAAGYMMIAFGIWVTIIPLLVNVFLWQYATNVQKRNDDGIVELEYAIEYYKENEK